jgi:dGTPase
MITAMIADVVRETRKRLAERAPSSPDDIRCASVATVAFSPGMAEDLAGLRAFLFARVYRHPRVLRIMQGAMTIVADLFARYHVDGSTLPETWAAAARGLDERRCARLIADFVAGQTDRFALSEHSRLFDATPELR